MNRLTRKQRPGFTLIELLVVIAIIAVLMALLLPAIAGVRRTAMIAQARNDISQLDTACNSFKVKYNVYPPSRVILRNVYNPASPEFEIMRRVWPKLNPTCGAAGAYGVPDGSVLQGDQCLVFFLGGIGQRGFFSNPASPFVSAGEQQAPFFDFPTNRLRIYVGGERAPAPSFVDAFDSGDFSRAKPYLYFASYRGNDYESAYRAIGPGAGVPHINYPGGPVPPTGAIALPFAQGPIPMIAAQLRFANAEKVQIISAGPDQVFSTPPVIYTAMGAPSSAWAPGNASWTVGTPGADDLTNFHGNKMGLE